MAIMRGLPQPKRGGSVKATSLDRNEAPFDDAVEAGMHRG
jgi:hypothetical protein